MKEINFKLWCGICEKFKLTHYSLYGVIVHERKDVPEGELYFIRDSDFKLTKRRKWFNI